MIKQFINLFFYNKNKYKYDLLWFVFSIIFIPISYFIFYYLVGSKMHIGIIIFALGMSKFLVIIIGEVYEPSFGDKRFTPLLKYISYSNMLFAMFVCLFLLLKDAQENQSVLNKYNDEIIITPLKTIDKNNTELTPFKTHLIDLKSK